MCKGTSATWSLISVGYGRDAAGIVRLNFGPLNQDGGERRLNVLITRARVRCEVFSNITADDIALERTSARGLAVLKTFLQYSKSGVLDPLKSSGPHPESPFEEAVAETLRSHGLQVDHQVGTGGYFLDLAVRDPRQPGRYLLAIECDGASYHSARWARDRDRLRQEALERLGWRFHRIWSTDWYRNRDREVRRLLTAVEAAGSSSARPVAPAARTEPGSHAHSATVPSAQSPATALSAEPYKLADLQLPLVDELHRVQTSYLANWVEQVTAVESPVHFDEVCARIVAATGGERVGSRIRSAIWQGACGGRTQRSGGLSSTFPLAPRPNRTYCEGPLSSTDGVAG
ncbi:MAG: DUF3320 domain-containing protein [Thermoanaerobaculaceae bacterium]